MKGLVSYSLFGDNPLYLRGAIRNVEIWNESPFDVDTAFYVSSTVPGVLIDELTRLGATVHHRDGPDNQLATFWRFEAFKSDYDYVLSRDVDSRPGEREFICLQEWFDHELPFHVIRDHPYHGVPILAGLFGVKRRLLGFVSQSLPTEIPDNYYTIINKAVNRLSCHYESNDFYQIDQWWLRLQLYPQLRNKVMAHDDFFAFERRRYKHPTPPRVNNEFIAEGFDQFDNPRYPEHRELFAKWPRMK